jgi:hypothetical protein
VVGFAVLGLRLVGVLRTALTDGLLSFKVGHIKRGYINKIMLYRHTHSHTLVTHTHTLILVTHTHTLLTNKLTHTRSHTLTHIHTHSHTYTFTHTHSLTHPHYHSHTLTH